LFVATRVALEVKGHRSDNLSHYLKNTLRVAFVGGQFFVQNLEKPGSSVFVSKGKETWKNE